MQQNYTAIYIDRFWGKVKKTDDPKECWIWTGGCRTGYGLVYMGDKKHSAHRVAYELTYGEIPDGLDILHTCDNPPCCNPNHLILGTHLENMRDMISKGRSNYPKREKHRHKLTESQVSEIRKRYGYHGIGGDDSITLAKEFGVSHTMIHCIVRGKNWT